MFFSISPASISTVGSEYGVLKLQYKVTILSKHEMIARAKLKRYGHAVNPLHVALVERLPGLSDSHDINIASSLVSLPAGEFGVRVRNNSDRVVKLSRKLEIAKVCEIEQM